MKSKLVPIAKLIQRRLFWICNLVLEPLWNADIDIIENESKAEDDEDIIFDSSELVEVYYDY